MIREHALGRNTRPIGASRDETKEPQKDFSYWLNIEEEEEQEILVDLVQVNHNLYKIYRILHSFHVTPSNHEQIPTY